MSSDGSVNNYPTPEIIILSDDDDMQEVDDTNSYFQNISLRYFVDEPLEMKTQHEDFKDLCMMNGNPEAHYIEGILQYFEHENKVTVRVAIVKLWKDYSASCDQTIEMVLIDANGDKIQAMVKNDLVNQFEEILAEGKTFIFTKFALSREFGSYRATNHRYKINFLSTTLVMITDDLPTGLNIFAPVKFNDVLDGSLNPDFLVDVFGHVIEVGHLEMSSVNGRVIEKISLQIRDLDDVRLRIVLWGKLAQIVSDDIQNHDAKRIILVLTLGKINVSEGDRYMSNALNISEVELNPNIPVVDQFRVLLQNDELGIDIVVAKPKIVISSVSEKEDFLRKTPRKTIAEMIECHQGDKCIVMCTIGAIESDMGWYYLTCKFCSMAVQYEPPLVSGDPYVGDLKKSKIYCSKCQRYDPNVLPRYKLHLVVFDNTGSSKFLLFDHLARKLLDQPCIELTGPLADEDPYVLPLALLNLIGKTYLFKIEILRENFMYKHDIFKVNKIITNLDIISEFLRQKSLKIISPECSSQQRDPSDLTPAKRRVGPVVNLDEEPYLNSVTKSGITTRIKKEKHDKSG
ncbi:replication protein A 70 kDa DNA-binding subunit A-like [Raphanus sativus]|uniref:Replication protein A 70 kDa DNA-binding subunit A-like n=1 Tax=Raphanus sativus TaxID=3726 RepID=A0A6J0K7W2_RAPSA|nr:replication protein A 70 kDa DNA-binding subunit A-like [Raphanus sativus]